MPKMKKRSIKTKLEPPKKQTEFSKLINSKISKATKRVQKRKALLPKKRDISLKNGVKITSKNIIPSFLRKRKKRDLFALNSSDEEFGFTHNGRGIDDMDGKELNEYRGLAENSTNPNHIDTDIVNKLNFSGFEEDPENNEKKTRKEIYEEIIKKSKLRKMEAQREQEENIQLGKELDEKFDNLFKELSMRSKKKLKTGPVDSYQSISRKMMFEPKLKAKVEINEEKKKERENEKRKKIVSLFTKLFFKRQKTLMKTLKNMMDILSMMMQWSLIKKKKIREK